MNNGREMTLLGYRSVGVGLGFNILPADTSGLTVKQFLQSSSLKAIFVCYMVHTEQFRIYR